jgi:hypothetical protein
MKKIVGVIVIVGTFGAVTLCLHRGTALNDTELANIQGGASCQHCADDGDGCGASGGQTDNCDMAHGCEGSEWSSCLQAQKKCIDKVTAESCSPTSPNCSGTYLIWDCKKVTDEREEELCMWVARSPSVNCSGMKTGC